MPQHDNTPRDDRWKIGDKALCVMPRPWRGYKTRRLLTGPTPKFGKIYIVDGFGLKDGKLFLGLAGLPRKWGARWFIKATPTEDLVDKERVVRRTDRIVEKV